MRASLSAFRLGSFLAGLLLLAGCKDGIVEPDRFGSIQGRVLDFQSFAPLGGALVTTSPATDAVLTGEDGSFQIESALIGTYTITARRSGYATNTTTISIREGQIGRAEVLLEVSDDDDDEPQGGELTAQVLNFTNEPFTADSSFVSVEYRATNGGETTITDYDVYFRIETDRGLFYQQVTGTSLGPGRSTFGTFRKALLGAVASAVIVEGTADGTRTAPVQAILRQRRP